MRMRTAEELGLTPQELEEQVELANDVIAEIMAEEKGSGPPYGPGEHPADEDCRGLCGAEACMKRALEEMGIVMGDER